VLLYAVSGLVRLIHEPFRHRAPNWHEQQEKILDRAEEMLTEVGEPSISQASKWQTSKGRTKPSIDPCAGGGTGFMRSAGINSKVEVVDQFHARDDTGVPFLADALVPSLACTIVGAIAQKHYAETELKLQAIRTLRHKPARRCLIAYEFLRGRDQQPLTLLGKVHAKKRHEQSFRLQQSFWDSGFDDQSDDGISVPRPVGVVPQWNMWLQEYVPGQNGWEALLGPDNLSASKQIADAAYKLHQANIPSDRAHTIDDELGILEDRLKQVLLSQPRLAERIYAVLTFCHELASKVCLPQRTGIHRDFYPDQVLFCNSRIYLLDFDLYCQGQSCLDIGNFCAHLQELRIRHPRNTKVLEAAEQHIRHQYLARSGQDNLAEVDTFTTLSLIRHIYLSTIFKERQDATLRILSECENRLSLLSGGP
jgi:hypothetical protein